MVEQVALLGVGASAPKNILPQLSTPQVRGGCLLQHVATRAWVDILRGCGML
jgi:hypothetical protein